MEIIRWVFFILSQAVFWATIGVAGLLFLRVILNWAGVNPFGRVAYYVTHVTEPLLRPMRRQLGSQRLRYDLLPLVLAIMILLVGLFASSVIGQLGGSLLSIMRNLSYGRGLTGAMLGEIITLLSLLYVVAIFLRWLLPFMGVGYGNKWMRFIYKITEPLLKPLRKYLTFGMIDFSPMAAMFLVQLVAGLLSSLLSR